MGASDKAFRMQHIKLVQQHTDAGTPVVITVQQTSGTAWQKTMYRVMKELAIGKKRVAILTNADNPELQNLRHMVAMIHDLVQGVSVVIDVRHLGARQERRY